MLETFEPDIFKKTYMSYYRKWCVAWGVIMVLLVALILTSYTINSESQIIATGLFVIDRIALGILTGYGLIGIAVVYAFAILAMSPGQALGIIAIGGINACGIIAIGVNAGGIIALGINAYGVIAIGPHAWGIYTLSNSEFGKGRYRFSPNHQDEQAVKFFTHFMPKLNTAFSPNS